MRFTSDLHSKKSPRGSTSSFWDIRKLDQTWQYFLLNKM